MSETVLRIAKWESVFERAESRKLKTLSWVAIPTSFSSNGFQELLDEFGDDSAAVYGAWCALVAFAASCTVRGTLATSQGAPIKITHIARITGFQITDFERLIKWAVQDSVAWLIPAQPHEIPKKHGLNDDSEKSPDVSGDLPEHTTRQTGQDITQQQQTALAPDVGRLSSAVEKLKNPDLEWVIDQANKLARSAKLDPKLIWQLAWVSSALDRDFVSEMIYKLKSGDVKSPSRYVKGAAREMCKEHAITWTQAVESVGPAPVKD